MKRELRALDAELMQLEHDMAEKNAAVQMIAGQITETEKALDGVHAEQREVERATISRRCGMSRCRVRWRVWDGT